MNRNENEAPTIVGGMLPQLVLGPMQAHLNVTSLAYFVMISSGLFTTLSLFLDRNRYERHKRQIELFGLRSVLVTRHPNRYLLRRGLYWAYNALISTDCLALRGVSPFSLTSFFESENCVGCSS